MGVQYNYYCDICGSMRVVEIAPFEESDPGENTPTGWFWQEKDETLICNNCRGGELG